MPESRDTAIKLFGKTITSLFVVADHDPSSSPVSASPGAGDSGKEASSSSSSLCSPSVGPGKVKKPAGDNNSFQDPLISSDLNEEPKTSSETSSPRSSKNNGDQHSEITTMTSTSHEKTAPRKPDRILPCPRCKSSETKFCYYNNYNVNQPRHFCKNCQRYWTAGGSMRNVPVGSGRRKNKAWASTSNQYLQIDAANNNNNNNSATILNFGSSGFMISDTGEDRPGDMKITAYSASQDVKNYQQGFLNPQVTLPIPHPWPYPAIPNANFYPMPFYWGCSVPLWSPPNTSPCPGKRTKDQASLETDRDSKDTERKRMVSESRRLDEPSEAKRSFVMSRPEKAEQDKLSMFNRLGTKDNNSRNVVSESSLALQANPAALARSMNFRESSSTVTDNT